MGSFAARRVAAALALACAVAFSPGVAVASVPTNDTVAGAHDLVVRNLKGTRNAANDAAVPSGVVFQIDTSEATASPDDPILRNDAEDSTCTAAPVQGDDTVFYRLVNGDTPAVPLPERTVLTIDTLNSTYQTAIAVYKGSISQEALIHCERGNLVGGAASVTFVTEPGVEYFVEVASVAGAGRLNLYVRATDVQPPRVSMSAPPLAEPGKKTKFRIPEPIERGSGLEIGRIVWSVEFIADGEMPKAGERQVLSPEVSPDGYEVAVTWPAGSALVGHGMATVQVWDQAGNMGGNSLDLRVKDRTPPAVRKPGYLRQPGLRRVRAWITCTEPGLAVIRLNGNHDSRPSKFKVRAGKRRTVVFRNVPRRNVYQVVYQCRDGRGNASPSKAWDFLFGF